MTLTANHLSARDHAANMLGKHVVSQGSGCKEFLSPTNWQTTPYSSDLKFRFSSLPQCGFAITGNFGDMFFANAQGEGWLRRSLKNLIKTGEADFDHIAQHMYASAIFAEGEDRNWHFYVLLYAAAYFFAADS